MLGNITLSSDPLSATWTSGRAGLHLDGTGSQTRAVSAATVAQLLPMLTATAGLTLEVWFTPEDPSQSGMIMGLGNWAAGGHESGTCGDHDLAVYQEGANVAVSALLNLPVNSCPSTPALPTTFSSSSSSSSTYMAISLKSSALSVSINATASVPIAVTQLDFSTWVSSMYLMFGQTEFNSNGVWTTSTWAGDIFLFALYDRTLTAAEVQQNYAAGIPLSVPVPVPTVTWLSVEQNPGSVLLSSLSSSPFTLGYANTDSALYSTVTMAITSAPASGQLFTPDFYTMIGGSNGAPVPFGFAEGQDFGYQPPAAFYGVDSFSFDASTSVGSGPNGIVNILVIAPPSSADLAASTVVSNQGAFQHNHLS